MVKNLFGNLKVILILIIVILLIIILVLFNMNSYKGEPFDATNQEKIIYEVRSGEDAYTLSQDLAKNEIIKDADYFYDLFLEQGGTIYANSYELSPSMTSLEIYNIVTSPISNVDPDDVNTLLIYEGENVEQVAETVALVFDMSVEEVLAYWSNDDNLNTWISSYNVLSDEILNDEILYPLEGYLYPATYTLDEDETLESLTTKILDTTESKYAPYLDQSFLNNYSFHQILTLASVVERETILDVDRPKVAGVFYNRINSDMPLQSDITVLYAMGEHKEEVTYEDLEYDSPYNTYLNMGLPPSPISSVSDKSLEATISPEESNYLYFFAKQDTGEVIYSETYEKHLEVSEKYAWE